VTSVPDQEATAGAQAPAEQAAWKKKATVSVESVERVAEPPFSRELLGRLGFRGLHSGCGTTLFAGCLNTDRIRVEDRRGNHSGAGHLVRLEDERYYLEHNAKQPFPCQDETFDWVYSEHFIEHLPREHAIGWLKEALRMLRPGGFVRLSTPDLRRYASAFAGNDKSFFLEHHERIAPVLGSVEEVPEADDPRLPAWMMNQLFYSWNHRWIYDLEELRHAAVAAGFEAAAVTECAFREGRLAEVAGLDQDWRSDESIYIEVTRN
jgi:SAM-dependent methyltransferase